MSQGDGCHAGQVVGEEVVADRTEPNQHHHHEAVLAQELVETLEPLPMRRATNSRPRWRE